MSSVGANFFLPILPQTNFHVYYSSNRCCKRAVTRLNGQKVAICFASRNSANRHPQKKSEWRVHFNNKKFEMATF